MRFAELHPQLQKLARQYWPELLVGDDVSPLAAIGLEEMHYEILALERRRLLRGADLSNVINIDGTTPDA